MPLELCATFLLLGVLQQPIYPELSLVYAASPLRCVALFGAVLLATVLLDAVASVPPVRMLGAPSVAACPWSAVAHLPLPVGVSVSLGQPVAL